ncbi:hypothetical protein LTR10_022454 [Elasticomyces elasticus]|uniref:glutathione transferase n=1 Tax=Exophiala sideris TaxID=1016849 RepID=A0ABR0J362_9EURO|nr:hypothetical protein LTR10_022454 [Elasticomyces elasticus]KAK5024890.1 hypothetical protein LTS07_008268 [Exophiala sideris]KAK5031520.1 hypothetical protein LTR13_007848 [Exophiala sideris]KAK5054929.1 hypothetical protein LTR69_008497 [Exophiala sideris]KAK5179808.1 hypothetical protein LTR44_007624 [Eurotiomycetes sp. CCFEE 6388]
MVNRVLGNVFSTRTQRVLFVLEELGVQYDFQSLDFAKAEHHASEYVSEFHPFARLPAFQDEKVKIFESRAISRYLAGKYSGSLTPPTDLVEAAYYDQAASVEHSYFEPPIEKLGFELVFKKQLGLGEADDQVVGYQTKLLLAALDYYESLLSKQEYLAGNTFSLIDIYNVPWVSFLEQRINFGKEIAARKKVAAWWAKVSGRPAWRKVLGRLPH